MNIKAWIEAARLRTLPLAIANMSMGNGLAAIDGKFSWSICLLSIWTAVSLQILSNLANDYGDSIHGADSAERKGPIRAVQSGILSSSQMKNAMILWSIIALISGITLIWIAIDALLLQILFLLLGIGAIWAAINYTAGSKPYGYSGKGDISVFVFFGLVSILGCYYLQTGTFQWMIILPAISCGALSVGVLNVNNIRDIHSDGLAGKRSIPIKIGRNAAVRYHGALLAIAILSVLIYTTINYIRPIQYLFLTIIPILTMHFIKVKNTQDAIALDPYLKQLALSTAVFVALFLIGNLA
ncbi:MAG: 1,4-dihydroxy-2-naphthoate octaprenyltransferase [Saprospiraceae bacterium]|jgi:1,4-dihydroxy-2-naphthoate octaprenyltransferase